MKYTLQAGRSILKDDLPFVHLVRSTVHSQGDFAYAPTEADTFAREAVAACNAAPILAQVIKDAIEMLRWQARKPVGAESWAQWVIDAMTALDEARPQ